MAQNTLWLGDTRIRAHPSSRIKPRRSGRSAIRLIWVLYGIAAISTAFYAFLQTTATAPAEGLARILYTLGNFCLVPFRVLPDAPPNALPWFALLVYGLLAWAVARLAADSS